ncbi:unnamed protein product [Strongylus vulgaris]|uniref:Uncharacterized protein n=1 Tax=Strongylus vulgaris TaxID=40348 RepID=A0A3P7J525_STRVU|nr:unnamed protein product [Strongylus vulgaris]
MMNLITTTPALSLFPSLPQLERDTCWNSHNGNVGRKGYLNRRDRCLWKQTSRPRMNIRARKEGGEGEGGEGSKLSNSNLPFGDLPPRSECFDLIIAL